MNQLYPQGGVVPNSNTMYPMANLQGSGYSPPITYNRSSEVVSGYDAQINPMTGQEIPQANFAGGGKVAPASGLASLVASKGRGEDKVLVHMTPSEVQGLQAIALAHGGSLTINPETGLPEAGFLKSLLPTIAGALLAATGVGAPLAALMVGGATGLIEKDWKKGLMAGIGAFGGASIGSGLSSAGAATKTLPSALPKTTGIELASQFGSGAGGAALETGSALADTALTAGTSAAETATTFGGRLANMGRGIQTLGTEAGREAFTKAIPGIGGSFGGKTAFAAAALPPLMYQPEYKPVKGPAPMFYTGAEFQQELNPEYGTAPGESYFTQRFTPGQYTTKYPGMAEGGEVEKAKAQALEAFAVPAAQATPSPAALESYIQNLNRFVAGAEQKAPTYIAPPPKPVVAPPPAPKPPVTPPTGPFEPFDFRDFDFSSLTRFGFDPNSVKQGLRNFGYQGDLGERYDPAQGKFVSANQPTATTPDNFDYSGIRGPDMSGVNPYMNAAGFVTPPEPPAYIPPEAPPYAPPEPYNFQPNLAGDTGQTVSQPFDYTPEPSYMPSEPQYPVQEFVGTPYMPEPAFEYAPAKYYEGMYKPFASQIPSMVQQDQPVSISPIERVGYDVIEEPAYVPRGESMPVYESPAQMSMIGQRELFDYSPDTLQFKSGGNVGLGSLGAYSDGGRLLRGPGDGVSDGIPAVIEGRDGKQPARLADGEFVVPARIVSEIGNGSTEAGARKLYAMMDKVQRDRRKTLGKKKAFAKNTRADRHLKSLA